MSDYQIWHGYPTMPHMPAAHNVYDIPCVSGFRQAFASIPTTLPSSLGLPRTGGASSWTNMSEVHKPKELRNKVLPEEPVWLSLVPEGPSLGTTKPSENCASSSTFSRLKFMWTGRPSSTDTSAAKIMKNLLNIKVSKVWTNQSKTTP